MSRTTEQPVRPGMKTEHPPAQDAEAIARERLDLYRKGLSGPLKDWDNERPKLRKILRQHRP